MTEARNRDLPGAIGCVMLIAVGIAAIAFSGDFSALGAVFPRTIGGLLIGLGMLYLLFVARGRTKTPTGVEGSTPRRVGVAIVMLGWAYALEPVGFLISSAVAFALLLLIAQHDGWTLRRALVYGLSGAVVLGSLYALFKILLLVPLP